MPSRLPCTSNLSRTFARVLGVHDFASLLERLGSPRAGALEYSAESANFRLTLE